MEDLEFLDEYSGQSVDELINMESKYRVDSLVLAFEQALQQKSDDSNGSRLTETEQIVLAVEALEREVNNGGYHQFFTNSSKEYAHIIVEALNNIGCPKTAEVSGQAIKCLGILGPLTEGSIDQAVSDNEDKIVDDMGDIDNLFYDAGEDIAGQLFEYIKKYKQQISFGK